MQKKYLVLFLIIFILVGAVLGIFLIKKKNIANQSTNQATQVEQKKTEIKNEMQKLNQLIDDKRKTDSDLDGLTNEEEASRGTDPNNMDTDSDGLLDGDEVKYWKTDPKKADTDGDGFKDGYEARRGYNPLGSGKLPTQK